MYQIPHHRGYGVQVSTPAQPQLELHSSQVVPVVRQHPKEALVTTDGKEKLRKPVDPPPIVELKVEERYDPAQHFMQSPYLFMCASLWKHDIDAPHDAQGEKSLAGSLVSSLHRLKDTNNKDGGFFIFGDISVKICGIFRLHFSLFDYKKHTNEIVFLRSVTTNPFRVVMPKDFRGLDESTYLSRTFSDQGVRLRLRKEPRTMMGKRAYPYGTQDPTLPNTPIAARPSIEYTNSPYHGDPSSSPAKRIRPNSDYENNGSHSGLSPFTQNQYAVQRPNYAMSMPQSMPQSMPSSMPSSLPSSISSSMSSSMSSLQHFTGQATSPMSNHAFQPATPFPEYRVESAGSASVQNSMMPLPQPIQHNQQQMSQSYSHQHPVQTPSSYSDSSLNNIGSYRTPSNAFADTRLISASNLLASTPLHSHHDLTEDPLGSLSSTNYYTQPGH